MQNALTLSWLQVLADLAAWTLAFSILCASLSGQVPGGELIAPIAIMILATLSIAADIVGKEKHSHWIEATGLVFGIGGTILGVFWAKRESITALKVLTGIGAVLSGFGALDAAAELSS